MKIGYPCVNNSLSCTSGATFRLKNYSAEALKEKVAANLSCLQEILNYNISNGILFFRIGSSIVPFASHQVCKFRWQEYFAEAFISLGTFIKKNSIRISMHPDQFTLINAKDKSIVNNSIRELVYHTKVLDLMELDSCAKVQIHVGGVYGDKAKSLERFVCNYAKLPQSVKDRLVVENDDRSYNLKDCLYIHRRTGIPVLLDVFHHELNNSGESPAEALRLAAKTWKKKDGAPMIDYSLQKRSARRGAHADSIIAAKFIRLLKEAKPYNSDIMLEIKDKEKSACRAVQLLSGKL